MTLTSSQLRALEIVKENPGIRPREFAGHMWPDSECWRRHTRCGHGVSRGGGMRLAAGGYLGRLRRQKLIRHSIVTSGYELTDEGRSSLDSTTPTAE